MTTKNTILLVNALLIISWILLEHFGMFQISLTGFAAVFIGIVILAIYRPQWVFWFFVGTLPLELISLVPESLGFDLRPYQLLGVGALFGYLIALIRKQEGYLLPKIIIADWLLLILIASGFISALFAPNVSISIFQAVIVFSFFILYICTRFFVQKAADIRMPAYIFLLSSVIVVLYAIYQNWCFANGCSHNEVMPGRPNATFPEADWFGMYIVFIIAIGYTVLLWSKILLHKGHLCFKSSCTGFVSFIRSKKIILPAVVYITLIMVYIALMITVARSAWLGAAMVIGLFLLILLVRRLFLGTLQFSLITLLSFGVAICMILSFELTSFALSQRAQSTSGLQEITVACHTSDSITELAQLHQLKNMHELTMYNCQHIDLEEIDAQKQSGRHITTVYRADPNISIRKDVYAQSLALAKEHWLFGVGWGSSAHFLGNDDNGTALNASNIFLEIWLSTGIMGLGSFLAFIILLLLRATRSFFGDKKEEVLSVLTILGLSAIIIPNLFNAGLLLGFIWVFFGIVAKAYNE